jgi:coenzyme F420 hydrogenase subunit beta
MIYNEMLGNFRNVYFGCSTEFALRRSASSGGIVSSILIYLLEKKFVNGAIVVGMDRAYPWKTKIRVVKNREEVYETAQSKYAVVPVNSFLRQIRKANGTFVMVGLPCHVHGLMNLIYYASDKVKEKIALRIGLFCGFNVEATATTFLLDKLGITNYSTIKKVEYRGGGYPARVFGQAYE